MLHSLQGRIKTKLGLMLLPGKGPVFFSAFKTDQEVQDPYTVMGTNYLLSSYNYFLTTCLKK